MGPPLRWGLISSTAGLAPASPFLSGCVGGPLLFERGRLHQLRGSARALYTCLDNLLSDACLGPWTSSDALALRGDNCLGPCMVGWEGAGLCSTWGLGPGTRSVLWRLEFQRSSIRSKASQNITEHRVACLRRLSSALVKLMRLTSDSPQAKHAETDPPPWHAYDGTLPTA